MNIDKSQIIGKSIKDIPKDIILTIHRDSKEYHSIWKTAPKRAIDFLSRCILRYTNSYGATYQISPTRELTIISNKGLSYTLESYTKLLDLIIVDYQDTSEDKQMNNQPTIADIKIGTHWERLETMSSNKPKGQIIIITQTDGHNVRWYETDEGTCHRYAEDFLESFEPRPDLDNLLVDKYKKQITQAKPNTVAQPEPTKPIKSENTFMSKIKQTALTTVDQNKQATIIASKMEAGRILNKQIIKQTKPHVPMFFRGYLDTPLAPVILANLVALAGNHTDNKRVKQISELMLLAAADTTIQSFNLDQIIDDVLKNIKLPTGILDDNDE